jgi:hypothetical protein
MLLRTSATATEGFECLLAEILSVSTLSAKRRSTLQQAAVEVARKDRAPLRRWIRKALGEKPPERVRSLWFFVSESAPYSLRLAGSPTLASADSYDWAADRAWSSPGQAPSKLLADFERLFARIDDACRRDISYLIPIAYPSFAVNELLRVESSLFHGSGPERAVVVGYEDGDFFPLVLPRE